MKLDSLPLNVPAHITHNNKHHLKVHTRGVWAVVKPPSDTGLSSTTFLSSDWPTPDVEIYVVCMASVGDTL